MKNGILFLSLLFVCTQAMAQKKYFTLGGGYVSAGLENSSHSTSGWRLNGTLEFPSRHGLTMHGVDLGYIQTSAEITEMSGGQPVESKYTITTWPIYYAPKFMIGMDKIQGYIKPLFGMQFSSLKRTGTLETATSSDAGLFAGIGAGGMYNFTGDFFLYLEYEWAYQSNSYYNDGFIHSFMVGFGKSLK